AQFPRLPASQRRQPCFGFDGDRRLLARARAIVQRCHRAFDHGPFYATLDGLMMEAERSAYRKKRRVFPLRPQNPRPLHPPPRPPATPHAVPPPPTRTLTPHPQLTRPPPPCHRLQSFVLNAPAHIGA